MKHRLAILAPALLAGCWLEEVTGEDVPLDPRFYEAVEKAQGQPGVGGGSAVPFSDWEGARVVVRGEVQGGEAGTSVDLDVRVPDPSKPGGVDPKGKILLEGPGPFELSVPADLGALELQAFQDLDDDGPTADDPFAEARLGVEDADLEGIVLELKVGARGGGPVHQEMPHGAPGGQPPTDAPQAPPGSPPPGAPPGLPPPGTPPPPGGGDEMPFVGHVGPKVALRGSLVWAGEGPIVLDLYRPDTRTPGSRDRIGKLSLPPGPFEIQVPAGYGPLSFEAFIDLDHNGPGPGDPRGCYPDGPVIIGKSDVEGVDIELSIAKDGKVSTCGGPSPPPAPGGR